jgi:hypothetical protein
MTRKLAAIGLAAALAQPAAAATFPSLTTIYVGSGVRDDGGANNMGIATTFNCSNVSGQTASVRFLVLNSVGVVVGNLTTSIQHGLTVTVSTHSTTTFFDNGGLATGLVGQGVVNIESTQSGVFCNAVILDGADAGDGFILPLVRVNPHPGTVE